MNDSQQIFKPASPAPAAGWRVVCHVDDYVCGTRLATKLCRRKHIKLAADSEARTCSWLACCGPRSPC
jgi:hypothetical protein